MDAAPSRPHVGDAVIIDKQTWRVVQVGDTTVCLERFTDPSVRVWFPLSAKLDVIPQEVVL